MKSFLPFLFFALAPALGAQTPLSTAQIDAVVADAMQTFDVPGISVAVVKDGQLVHAKGYGLRSINGKEAVDANTLFGIASNSKAFTAAALAVLVDEGKLRWDDKVTQYLPYFKMYNNYVSQEFTIRDLLTHRSGLGLGAGDLMIWPDHNNFTTRDIIFNLRYLKPVSAFRTKYDYDNLLYIVAGEVVREASGQSWEDFVQQRFLSPLGMTQTAPSFTRLRDTSNVISPHVPTDGKLKVISRYKGETFNAAAGLYSSAEDLSKWVAMLLNKGRTADGKILLSEAQLKELWTPQTLMPVTNMSPYKSNFKAYALGWQITDINGYKQVSHTGGLDGIVTQVLMIPELGLGIIVLTNQQSGAAFTAVTSAIKDAYLGMPTFDHVGQLGKQRREKEDSADKITAEVWQTIAKTNQKKQRADFEKIAGSFTDSWFGEIVLTRKKDVLYFESKRSPQLKGEVYFYKNNTFVVKWDNRSFLADAFLTYNPADDRLSMKPISPLTDFSYDFQDLDFVRNKSLK